MNKINKIPENIYCELNDYLCGLFEEIANEIDSSDEPYKSTCFSFTSDDNKWTINGKATGYFNYVDDSFTHEFGIEYGYHYELDRFEIDSIENDFRAYYYDYDEKTDIETELDIDFDVEFFEHMYDKTTIRINNVEINSGDTVMYKHFYGGDWKTGIFTSKSPSYYYIANELSKYGITAVRVKPCVENMKYNNK